MPAQFIAVEGYNDTALVTAGFISKDIRINVPGDAEEGDLLVVAVACDQNQSTFPDIDSEWRLARASDEGAPFYVLLKNCSVTDPGSHLLIGELSDDPKMIVTACFVFRDAISQEYQLHGIGDISTSYKTGSSLPPISPDAPLEEGWLHVGHVYHLQNSGFGFDVLNMEPEEKIFKETVHIEWDRATTLYACFTTVNREDFSYENHPKFPGIQTPFYRSYINFPIKTDEQGWPEDAVASPPTFQSFEMSVSFPVGVDQWDQELRYRAKLSLENEEWGSSSLSREDSSNLIEGIRNTMRDLGWDVDTPLHVHRLEETFNFIPEPEIDDWTL